jgi:hypothetical protein
MITLVGDARMPATDGASSAVTNATFTPPEGLEVNDLVLVFASVRNAAVTISAPSTDGQTWTGNTAVQANNLTYRSFYCKFNGTWSANPNFSWVTSAPYVMWMVVFRGVNTTTAVDAAEVTASQAAAATFTNASSAITTATDNAVVVHCFTSADDNTWGSHTSGFSLPYARTQWRNASTTGNSITIGYQTQAAHGGSTSFSATEATLGNDAGIRAVIALKPASVAAVDNFCKVDDVDTGTGTTPVTKTGYTGKPKLVIGMLSRVVGASGGINGLCQGIGIMAEGQTRFIYTGAEDNVGFGNSVIAQYKNLFMGAWDPANPDSDAAAKHKATLVRTSDGFTYTPTVAAPASYRVFTQAWGGDDIQQAAIAEIALPLGTGSVTYSNLFPFQPDFLIFINTGINASSLNALTTGVDTDESVGPSFGFCDASLNMAACTGVANSQASGATTGSSITKTGSAFLEFDWTAEFNGTHAIRYEGVITALTSSGFTMNWTTVSGTTSGANARTVIGIKLSSSGKMRVVNFNSATTVSDVTVTTDTGGTALATPVGAFLASGCSGTGGTARSLDETLMVGMSDGTANRACFWWYDQGGGSGGSVPTDNRSYSNSSYGYIQRSNDNASTAVGSAVVDTFSSGFKARFDDGDPSANTVVGFVFGPAPAAASVNIDLNTGSNGIASAEAFGTATVGIGIQPTGISSAEAFGTPTVSIGIQPTGIASAEAFGAPTVSIGIQPTGIASAEAFGTPTVSIGIAPAGIASDEASALRRLGSGSSLPGLHPMKRSGLQRS